MLSKFKNNFIYNLDIILILIGSLIVGIVLYYLTGLWELLASILLTGVTLAFNISQTNLSNDRMFKELFSEFNHKYNVLNDYLEKIKSLKESQLNEKQKIVDYFNLCAEEYLWYKRRRIPNDIWNSWKTGISYYKSCEKFQRVAQDESHYDSSYYNFFSEVWNKLQ